MRDSTLSRATVASYLLNQLTFVLGIETNKETTWQVIAKKYAELMDEAIEIEKNTESVIEKLTNEKQQEYEKAYEEQIDNGAPRP